MQIIPSKMLPERDKDALRAFLEGCRETAKAKNHYQIASISLAVKDSLTGLYNRRYFDVHHSAMVQQAEELNKPLTFMMVDIDHFKNVNDTHGHQAGDLILHQVAQRMQSCLRSIDLVARYGGEEFIVITNAAPTSLTFDIAKRISNAISGKPIMLNVEGVAISLTITVSIGAASRIEGDTSETLLARADKCVYQAKENGRNQDIYVLK